MTQLGGKMAYTPRNAICWRWNVLYGSLLILGNLNQIKSPPANYFSQPRSGSLEKKEPRVLRDSLGSLRWPSGAIPTHACAPRSSEGVQRCIHTQFSSLVACFLGRFLCRAAVGRGMERAQQQ